MKRVNPCTSSVTKGDTIMLMTPELLRGETCVFIHLLNYLEQHNGTYPKWCNGTNPNEVLACFKTHSSQTICSPYIRQSHSNCMTNSKNSVNSTTQKKKPTLMNSYHAIIGLSKNAMTTFKKSMSIMTIWQHRMNNNEHTSSSVNMVLMMTPCGNRVYAKPYSICVIVDIHYRTDSFTQKGGLLI